MEASDKLGLKNTVNLAWVPIHIEIQGNEMADVLAEKGSLADTEIAPVGIPLISGISQIKSYVQHEHSRGWTKNKACKTARAIMPKLSTKRAKQLISMNRRELSTTIRLLTSHGLFKSHCKNIGVGKDTNCKFYREDEEGCLHILCE